MINNNRIVPITKIDYLSLISTVIKLIKNGNFAEVPFQIFSTVTNEPGVFNFDSGSGDMGIVLANEPIKTFNIGSSVSALVVYFVPDSAYEGFSINGTAVTATGAPVNTDGVSLYKATLSDGAISIAAV